MSEEEKSSISRNVLEQIQSGKIKQTSRAYFMFRLGLFIAAVLTVTLLVVYTVSLVVFSLRSSGAWFAPGFGLSATRSALFVVPWMLVGMVGIAVLLLEVLVRRFGFAYRRPVVYSVIGIVVLVVIAGYALTLTPLHRSLYRQAHGTRPPFWSAVYRGLDAGPDRPLHAGFVNVLDEQGFLLSAREGVDFQVYITPVTTLPRERELRDGDFVLVFGPVEKQGIYAEGIRFAPDEMRGFGRRSPRGRMPE